MKETIPEAPGEFSTEPAPVRRTKRANALKVIASLLVVIVIVGGFIILFASRHPQPGQSGHSRTASATTNSAPASSDSFGWANIQAVAIVGGTLYASDDSHYLYAIQVSNGAEHRYYFNRVGASPVVDQSTLYMVVEQGQFDYMKAWRLDGGALTPLWSHQMICCARSPIAVAGGIVYVFAGGPIGSISALRASNGSLLWNHPTNGPSGISLTVANGVLYAGMNGERGGVSALNASSGKLLWQFQESIGSGVMAAPTVVNGVVYAASTNRQVYALRASDGSLLWRYTTDYAMMTSPVVSNGVVYVGTGDNSVFALRAADGSLLWHQRIDKLFPLPNIPNRFYGVFVSTVGDGTVYVGSEDGYLCALRVSDGALLWHRQLDGLVQ